MHIPFTQTKEYLGWHEASGTKTFYREFFTKNDPEKVLIATATFVVTQLRIGKVLYCPYGPVFYIEPKKEELKNIFKEIKDLAEEENCVFVRMEGGKVFANDGIWQPRVEWWLDITESEEEILNRIHKDHKYSIRRAQKENIEVEIVSHNLHDYFEKFWKLMQVTSARDEFSLYNENYYKQIFKSGNEVHEHELKKFLVFTKLGGEYLSVALIVAKDKVANLVFAGSVSERREFGFNHLMQWSAILEAKKHACEIYNFGGISENIDGRNYGKRSLIGVTNFKKKFGGYAKFHGNFLDIPVQKFRYYIYIFRKMLY